ncbi:mucin-associated surface protein (MASP), putative, partial [Trypanosoma cruzi marinkellei]
MQVTGAMAMMSGRVLLVCALCVLWCGAAGAMSAADVFTSDRSVAEEDFVLFWHNYYNTTCKQETTKGGMFDEPAFKSCMYESMREVCGGDDETSGTSRTPAGKEICKRYAGDPEEAGETSTLQDKPSPDVELPNGGTAREESTPGAPAGDSPANKTEVPESTSAAVDSANNQNEKDDEVVMPTNAPESNATGKREEKKAKRRTVIRM